MRSCSFVWVSVSQTDRHTAVLSPLLFAVSIDDIQKLCDHRNDCFLIPYAYDISLKTSYSAAEFVIWELVDFDMFIIKSCCLSIGPRYDTTCVNIAACDGR